MEAAVVFCFSFRERSQRKAEPKRRGEAPIKYARSTKYFYVRSKYKKKVTWGTHERQHDTRIEYIFIMHSQNKKTRQITQTQDTPNMYAPATSHAHIHPGGRFQRLPALYGAPISRKRRELYERDPQGFVVGQSLPPPQRQPKDGQSANIA